MISKLPKGLTEVALSGVLSMKLIQFCMHTFEWAAYFDPSADECCQCKEYYTTGLKLITTLADILARYEMKPEERILAIGIYAYINSIDGRKKNYRQPRRLEGLLVGIGNLALNLTLSDALLWAALSIAANNEPMSGSAPNRWCLLDRYLEQPQTSADWFDVLRIIREFIWTPYFEERWQDYWIEALKRRDDRQSQNAST